MTEPTIRELSLSERIIAGLPLTPEELRVIRCERFTRRDAKTKPASTAYRPVRLRRAAMEA